MEGMVLLSKISSGAVINDHRVAVFSDAVRVNMPDNTQLVSDTKRFQLELLAELFDFKDFVFPLNGAISHFNKNQHTLKGSVSEPLRFIRDSINDELTKVSTNFQLQLERISQTLLDLEQDTVAQERIMKAVAYYQNFINEKIVEKRSLVHFSTDNKEVRKELEKYIALIDALIHLKKVSFKGLENGFKTHKYLELRARAHLFEVEKPKLKKETATTTQNVSLLNELRDLRTEYAEAEMVEKFHIFTQATLFELCEKLPQNLNQLKKINGIGKVKLAKYGEAILDVILDYCTQKGIELQPETAIEEKPLLPKPIKGETYRTSLEMFQQGKSIQEIATERGLAVATIEGHLYRYVTSGEIAITDIIPLERFEQLKKSISNIVFENLSDLRQQLGDEYSYNELKLTLDVLQTNDSE
jgi:hypothetical protein